VRSTTWGNENGGLASNVPFSFTSGFSLMLVHGPLFGNRFNGFPLKEKQTFETGNNIRD
jgi:hypothetical protein